MPCGCPVILAEDRWGHCEILHRTFCLGVLEKRAEWFVKWSETVAAAGEININSFEEGLGRIAYVAGALEFERPFLAPLYRFLTLHPRGSTRRVPAYVSFILRYQASQLQRQRHYNCESVDAQVRRTRHELMLKPIWKGLESEVGNRSKTGNIDTRLSPWYSVEIRREDWPWIYERDDKPALVISTLEALAILIALKLFHGSTSTDRRKVTVAPTWTDNRGNGALLHKLMTTRACCTRSVHVLFHHVVPSAHHYSFGAVKCYVVFPGREAYAVVFNCAS